MFNIKKCILFILATLLYIITLGVKADHKILVTLGYFIFILVGLYDLGNDDATNEDKQHSEKIN